jgi:hypothetical protein
MPAASTGAKASWYEHKHELQHQYKVLTGNASQSEGTDEQAQLDAQDSHASMLATGSVFAVIMTVHPQDFTG